MYFRTGLIAASLSIAMVMYSCNSNDKQQEATAAYQMSAVPTDFIQLRISDAEISTGYPGSIEGQDNVELKAQATGYLEAVLVKEGQYVNKGQTLFKINSSVYNEQVNTSRAGLKSALANQAAARLEVEKLKPLVEGKVVSDMQLKTAQANYEAASAQVAQAKSALGSSSINAGFTFIKAPVSGYIGRIPNRIGTLVSPSDASPLTTLSNINTVNVYFSMNEADYISLAKSSAQLSNNDVNLLLADGSTYDLKGQLETASGNFDKNTGSIQMKAVFQNPNRLLRSGGTARVIIRKNASSIVRVPKNAVKDIQDKFFVYKLVGKGKVQMIPIEIEGGTANDYFVKSGVQAGDKVAINSIDMLTDGVQVVAKVVPQK
ncbi:efflux RND transporter periplasmic adaptor subunit [Chryseobacterium cheonjiense]|uniref:Efflux RND transporter periplasmic adaptor subunit n=1 Tax=Chryseobacterium cheonjiense TaxID=2728845 RepID=A0A7Y0FHS6_9FLAO|nr:efflux RND transporter periplasmic adaptor subunit [Chryseobacterium cheonjiense]NML56679.1 efflux RND transporter periplasmic adaptor subunit [Chryseobacterium cheonjiense]